MSVKSNHQARRLPRDAHPFVVAELVVYPTARPREQRRVHVPGELRTMDFDRLREAWVLFEFLQREA